MEIQPPATQQPLPHIPPAPPPDGGRQQTPEELERLAQEEAGIKPPAAPAAPAPQGESAGEPRKGPGRPRKSRATPGKGPVPPQLAAAHERKRREREAAKAADEAAAARIREGAAQEQQQVVKQRTAAEIADAKARAHDTAVFAVGMYQQGLAILGGPPLSQVEGQRIYDAGVKVLVKYHVEPEPEWLLAGALVVPVLARLFPGAVPAPAPDTAAGRQAPPAAAPAPQQGAEVHHFPKQGGGAA